MQLLESSEFLRTNTSVKDKVGEHICKFDLGISDISYEQVEGVDDEGNKKELTIPFGIHKSNDGEFKLPFFAEPSGTKSA